MLTPPASPSSLGSSSITSSISYTNGASPTHYLRALYAYEPEQADPQSSEHSNCLTLTRNTCIFVHNVHPSGWADGTLLSGERGWFPSNYCEAYVPFDLVPLHEAMAPVKDKLRQARMHEAISGIALIVACVRQLLVASKCLTRDCLLVRQHDEIRRDRKLLLSELSNLVSLAKGSDNSNDASHFLVRIERVSTRAARFFHTVGPPSGLYAVESAKIASSEMLPTPPVSYDFSDTLHRELDVQNRSNETASSAKAMQNPRYASQQLDETHEWLLSNLSEFIGHLQLENQSQVASQILLTTRACVNAARSLLSCLESICAAHSDHDLIVTKDHLYTDITKFVKKARDSVNGMTDNVVFESHRLIEAATSIVRGAGSCSTRAQFLLETCGDILLPEVEQGEDVEEFPSLPRDETTSSLASLASLVDHRQSRDVQAQVELLDIPYKKVAPLAHPQSTTMISSSQAARAGPVSSHKLASQSLAPEMVVSRESSMYNENDLEIVTNIEGQIIGASMTSLVERMTLPQSMPEILFASTFFLTFRLFSTPSDLARILIARFEWALTYGSTNADWYSTNGMPIKLRVYNVLKGWLESYWRTDQDSEALPLIKAFAAGTLLKCLPQAGSRLSTIVSKLYEVSNESNCRQISLLGKATTVMTLSAGAEAPAPASIINKSQLMRLRSALAGDTTESSVEDRLCILDFDEIEIARQLTILESQMFCAIKPLELIGQEFSKKADVSLATNVKAMSAASTDLAGWVADSILWESEQKRRTLILKHWIKIGERCLQFHNYNTLMAIMCALNSSTIARLRRTWDGLSKGQKISLEQLRSVTDHQRNYAVYRSKIKTAHLPCLPFLGLYLTDLVFVDEGNPNHRSSKSSGKSLINFDKHMKTAKIVSDLQRFQVTYKYNEVPELSAWIAASCMRMRESATDLSGNLWRRSLVLEPKLPVTMRREPSIASSSESELWSAKKLGFLSNW